NKIIAVGKTVLNYANPIFWFRKLAIKPSTTLVTKEACKYIISIFGEETNKIYSKKYRQTAEEIAKAEADFDKLIAETSAYEGPEESEEVVREK
ncbi:MAG: hypothetical protein PHP32_06390, partial [Candidatus Izemoplasmatales bacterium]|nr:hypothetical protein [Candidatus Izemoplasmatales bacterium]